MITFQVDNQAHLYPASDLPGSVLNRIKARLTFPNPAYLEAQKRGFSTWKILQQIQGYRVAADALIIPRGFTAQLVEILRGSGVQYCLEDHRRTLPEVDFHFLGELRDFQKTAVDEMASRDFGTLSMPTGAGKTVAALNLIARRRQPALIVVHRQELLEQWQARIETFLSIPAREVGIIGGGKKRRGDKITVGLVQSLCKCASDVAPFIGNLIVDECHRCPSPTFTEVVTAFDCRYMKGLSATPWRRDGLSQLIYWHLGDLVHEVDKDALEEAGHVLQAEVIWRKTNFESAFNGSTEYPQLLSELTQDPERNALIADDVAQKARNGGGICLCLSDRKDHLKILVELLAAREVKADLLTGGLSKGERQEVVAALNAGEVKVLVATSQLVGEGFDCRGLTSLFLMTPIRSSARLLQCLGRVLRPAPGKEKAFVYDYFDLKVGVFENAARARQRVYGTETN
jgi:superfamily II DNA or RNA helicase